MSCDAARSGAPSAKVNAWALVLELAICAYSWL